MSVLVSFMSTGGVLKYSHAVRPPPITIFGSQALDPTPTDDNHNADARPQTTAQTVNNARRRSYGRISEQDEADPNIRYKKSKSGSTKKTKIVGPRDYPGPNQSRHIGGSNAGPSQHTSSEQVEISVLCLPRTVGTHRSRVSRRTFLAHISSAAIFMR